MKQAETGNLVKIKIHFRSTSGSPIITEYDFPEEEYKHLISDFEKYRRYGTPSGGIYYCNLPAGSTGSNEVILDFEKILAIE